VIRLEHRVIAIAAFAFIAAAACAGSKGTTPPAGATLADSAEQVMYRVQHVLADGGVRKAQLRADSAYVFDNHNRYELRDSIILIILDSLGVPETTLTSDEATYFIARRTMEARGNVIVTTNKGHRLETQHLLYDEQADRISSDSAFVLTEPTRRLEGVRFSSDPDMEMFRCDGCKAIGLTPSGPPPPGAKAPPAQRPPDTLAHAKQAGPS
jgi:LPS export ABC transporter protein LptC